jgi:hypothetical protein
MKSVVSSAVEYTWVADLSADEEITITWDAFLSSENKKLVLDISDRVELIDMSQVNEVKIPQGNHKLKFLFGSDAFIEKHVLDVASRIGLAYPNPVSNGESSIHIPLSLPQGENIVELELADVIGKPIGLSAAYKLSGGRQVLSWNADLKNLTDGIYLLKVSIRNNTEGNKSTYLKLMMR